MRRFWHRMTGRQRLLLAVAGILGVFLFLRYADLPLDALPLPANIAVQEKRLLRLRKQVTRIKREEREQQAALRELRAQSSAFWQVLDGTPTAVVPTEFRKLTMQVQVQPQTVAAPRKNRVLDMTHVSEVEFGVRLTATMRTACRLLAGLDRTRPAFYWSRCKLQPDNKRDPQNVVINGRLRALVLSPEASRFLAAERSGNE